MKVFTLTILILISSITHSVEIENFKSGLMCGSDKDYLGWVCFEQKEILISGQSNCVSAGELFKCTWYGFSFDYNNAKKNQEISCSYSQSNPVSAIDINKRENNPKLTGTFKINLPEEEGSFVNPQYSALALSENNDPLKITTDVVCHSDDKKLFEYQFITIYPAKTSINSY
ncbi:MAG: hypothetical protein OEY96_14155 [Gammaproteobacteria bacterium]|nr:hypothetical protein [Gammaproteobacteria bacterium]